MIEHHLDIATADGAMNSFVVHPEEGGPFPVVLFYMDAPGKREELHDMARRLAAVGYFVVLPNLYYRRTRDFQLAERTEAAMAHMFTLMNSLNANTTACDTQAMLNFVDSHAASRCETARRSGLLHERPVRDVGGRDISRALRVHRIDPRRQHGERPARFTPPHGNAHPLRELFRLRRNRQMGAAQGHPALQAELQAAGTPHRIEWYPGVEHGFVFPQRGGIYNRAAAERHWERLFSLFGRRLRHEGRAA